MQAKVRTPLRGNYKIGLLGEGGVGKTTLRRALILLNPRRSARLSDTPTDGGSYETPGEKP
jgi:GTPase SAR1 family protein